MFHLTFIRRELRRRLGRTLLTALGLALGVGLVIGIIGVSQGLDDAQQDVLAPLSSVGTDILVTRVAGADATTTGGSTGSTTTTTADPTGGTGRRNGGGGFFGGGGPGGAGPGGINQADTQALLAENSNVITDLSKLGKPGDQFTRDFYLSATLVSFPQESVDTIRKIPGVTSAVGGLVQLAQHQTGTVPQIVATLQTGGQTFTQTVRPEPMTDAERQAFQDCLAAKGVTITAPTQGGGATGTPGQGGTGGTNGGTTRRQPGPAFDDCQPARFREFRAQFTTPVETLRQVVDPPSTDIKSDSYTAAGVDPSRKDVGLVTAEQLTSGRWLGTDAPNEVLVNVAYAGTKNLSLGSVIPINGTDHTVVGMVRPTLAGSTADLYFPLATLQEMAGKQGRVTQVLVAAKDSATVAKVAAVIKEQLPGAEVVTTKGLADQVTGSLADAQSLASRLGGALAAIVIVAAFAIAVLLTLSSIAKRVREIGTLRAIGWSKGRIIRQLVGETAGIGIIGGVLGILVGVVVKVAVEAGSPKLSATSSGIPGVGSSRLAGLFGQAQTVATTKDLTLHVPLHPSTLLLGVGFALIGGLLAGVVGGLRAAQLPPAVALRDLG